MAATQIVQCRPQMEDLTVEVKVLSAARCVCREALGALMPRPCSPINAALRDAPTCRLRRWARSDVFEHD